MKPKTHKFVINTAIDKLDIPLFKKYRKQILSGSVKADFSLWHLCLGGITHFYDPLKEKGYFLFRNAKQQGKKFFNKAIINYEKGKLKKSMIYLGIAVHLLEDTSIPSHTKVKMHLPSLFQDSLEGFMNKNLELIKIYIGNVKIAIKDSLDEYYDDLAMVSKDFKNKRVGFFPFLLRIIGVKKQSKKELIKQTKELGPLAISYTMGILNRFYDQIKLS